MLSHRELRNQSTNQLAIKPHKNFIFFSVREITFQWQEIWPDTIMRDQTFRTGFRQKLSPWLQAFKESRNTFVLGLFSNENFKWSKLTSDRTDFKDFINFNKVKFKRLFQNVDLTGVGKDVVKEEEEVCCRYLVLVDAYWFPYTLHWIKGRGSPPPFQVKTFWQS